MTDANISWTLNSTDEDGVRVYTRKSGDASWGSADADLSAGAESATITDVPDGVDLDVRVETYTADASSDDVLTSAATTPLPDEDAPVLGNGVLDEIAVDREAAVTNNGDVRYQLHRAEDAPDWEAADSFQQFIGAPETLSFEFVGLLDGERYEVRGRTETNDRTGAWTEPVAITTRFPAVVGLQATALSETEIELTWTDRADNEDGQRVIRERRVDGAWWPDEAIDDAGANTETYVDDTVQPDTQYRYRIEAYTPYTSAESATDTATTPALEGVSRRRIPASGWRVEVEHPSGETLTPTVLSGAEWRPRLNAKPRIRVPVPKSSTWEDHPVEGSTVRAWKDGTRLPIDTLRDVERDESQNVLVAIGGKKLDDDIEGVEYPEADAHVAAEEQIEEELGWVANVDDPQTDAREGVQVGFYGSSAQFTDGIQSADPFPETSPLTVFNNEVFAQQTGWFREAEDAAGDGVTYFADQEGNDGAWSGNETVLLQSQDAREVDFTTDYTIPEGEAEITIVYATPTDPTPGLEFTLDIGSGGTEVVSSFGQGSLNTTGGQFQLTAFDVTLNPSAVGDLPPGSHSVEVRVPGTEGGDIYLDFIHVWDNRFDHDTDTDPVDGVVTGWQQRPNVINVVFEPIGSVEQVVAGQVDATLAGGGAPDQLGLRNDTTDLWTTGPDTASLATSFDEPTQFIQARVTLGREDSGTQSGAFGDEPQRLDELAVSGDLVNTPVLLDFTHSGPYEELLNRIADAGDSIWELRRAPDADAPYRIEWTQPGQRVADHEPDVVSFEGERTINGSYQRVIARGKSKRVTGEEWTSSSGYGFVTAPDNLPIQTGSVTVSEIDSDTTYQRGVDYQVDHRRGIRVLEGGSMSTSTTYEIDYEWFYEGRYTQPGVDDPDTLREEFPDATSDRECEQLALAVVRQVADPLEEAEVTIRETDADRSLVASIPADEFPFEGPLRNRGVSSDAREVSLTLGSRESAGDVVDELRDRLSAVARNV